MSDPKQLDFWPKPRIDLREPPSSLEIILQESPKNQEIQSALVKTYDYIKQHKKIMCSISGGYDSDIMLDMLERCGGHGKVTYIFNDTKLEYDATRRHLEYLEERYGIKIERTEPKKSIPTCVREYGTPFWSKYVSGMITRLQKHGFQWEDEPFETLYARYPRNRSSLRWWCNDFKRTNGKTSKFNIEYAPFLKEFMVLNPPDFPISPVCCKYVKKDPAHKFLKDGKFDLNCTGIRKAEGGARSTTYKSCYDHIFAGPDNFRPIFWFTNQDKEVYREHYGIVRSDCYEVWCMKRTGCMGCPFGKDFEDELLMASQYEPEKYRAMNAIFGKSYEYTRKYLEFREKRKMEAT